MKYLPIGMLSSVLMLLCGCGDKSGSDDTQRTTNFIYTNETAGQVVIEYHYTVEENGGLVAKTKNENIGAGKSHTDSMVIPGMKNLILLDCDSVRMVFGDTKELWYYKSKEKSKKGNIFKLENYTMNKLSETETDYTYHIDRSAYDLATDVVP